MRYLITGHTGFKGSWLSMWLSRQGHEVFGLALDPEPGSLFERAGVTELIKRDLRGDVREFETVADAITLSRPEVLIHLAAQPLVRDSYRDPRWTIETNVMGTLNVLEAARSTPSLRAQVIVTTDKVYRNINQIEGYRESDALGGHDPYSASKAMADLLTQSWAQSLPGPQTSIARAGNVIGGGDVGRERLFPDVVGALQAGQAPELRYPQAVRPWQHVLDCLNGYLTLIDSMLKEEASFESGKAWNFGPDEESYATVGEVTALATRYWGSESHWIAAPPPEFHEAGLLTLDSGMAKRELGWRNLLQLPEAIRWTIDWSREASMTSDPRGTTLRQLERYWSLSSQGVVEAHE